jgi:hypothetical protein
MKTLIIPDVHEKMYELQNIIEKYPDVERRIFLGDYFDSFEYNQKYEHHEKFCYYLKELAADLKNIMLAGNHDVQYFDLTNRYGCSGYDRNKHYIITKILGSTWLDENLKFVHAELCNDKLFVFSHAGINPHFLKPYANLDVKYFENMNKDIQFKFTNNIKDPLLMAGQARWGFNKHGGITWQDWREEFKDIEEINQVVGHTIISEPYYNGKNLNLDSNLSHVALLDKTTGEITVEKV